MQASDGKKTCSEVQPIGQGTPLHLENALQSKSGTSPASSYLIYFV